MKLFCLLAVTIFVVQAVEPVEDYKSNKINDILNTQFEVKQIQEDIKTYQDTIQKDIKEICDKYEKQFLNETLSFNEKTTNIDYTCKNRTAVNLCLQTTESKLSTYKKIIVDYKICLSKAQIKYYQVPLDDYSYLLVHMIEALEKHIDNFAEECNYWGTKSMIVLTIDECFNLKKPGISAILYGLRKMNVQMKNLMYRYGEKVKYESKICASVQQMNLQRELINFQHKMNSCLENTN